MKVKGSQPQCKELHSRLAEVLSLSEAAVGVHQLIGF